MSVTTVSIVEWLRNFAAAVAENESLLIDLDSAIGDADHGSNLHRGMTAVVEHFDVERPTVVGDALRTAGMLLISTVGGASGVLYGTLLLRMATASGDRTVLASDELVDALRAGLEGVRARGQADVGDKTMVDVLAPAIDALEASVTAGAPLAAAASSAAIAAQAARDDTASLVARKGRASYLGERSVGHVDPGAASSALLFVALADSLVEGMATVRA